MGYYFLNFKLEAVLKSFVKSVAAPECSVITFGELVARNDELSEPWIAIRCATSTQGAADVQLGYSDNTRYFTSEIAIRTHAEDIYDADGVTVIKTATQYHADIASQVLDAFFQSTIQDDLNAHAQTVQNIAISEIDQPEIETGNEDRSFITVCRFRILASPTL